VTRLRDAFRQLQAMACCFVKPYRRDFYIGLLATAASNGCAVLIPLAFRAAIDDIVQRGSAAPLLVYGLAVIVLTGSKGLGEYLAHQRLAGMGQRVAFDLRNRLFSHLQTLSPTYFDRANTGDLMARTTSDVEGIRMFITWSLSHILEMMFLFIAALILMLAMSWQLTLIACTLLPPLAVTVVYFRRRLRSRYLAVQEQYGRMATTLQENLAGLRLIQAYQREKSEATRFQSLNKELFQRSLGAARERAIYLPLLLVLSSAAGGTILWFGGNQVISGRLTLGEFVAFLGYIALLAKPLTTVGWVISLAQRAAASLGRIEEVLAVPPMRSHTTTSEWPAATPDPACSEQPIVAFEHVYFAYNGHTVLHGIDLQGRRGELVAMTGPSGAGKSTIAHLIPRFYEVSAGRITLHGVDVRGLPLAVLRHHVAMVPQETFLFSVSVAENLAYGRPDSPPEVIRRSAQDTCLWESIHAFPQGMATLVGERGITLSGGQKQRVALARALLYGGDVLILDDPFSNVDAETEETLLETVRLAARDRFVLLISHRIRTLQAADRIIVVADGRIVAEGPHKTLLAQGGLYRNLYERQFLQESLA
jgi:ATP-binding cassette, subfamily B, multidrug efflux pump